MNLFKEAIRCKGHEIGFCLWNALVCFIFILLACLQTCQCEESFVNLGQHVLNVKAAKESPVMNLGIVSTWRGHSQSWANSWLRYHIAIGFSRFYLFFDDPEFDKDVIRALRTAQEFKPFLAIIEVDKNYRKKYYTFQNTKNKEPEYHLLHAFGVYLKTDINSRQILNVVRAGVLAKADNLNWLLHMDSDELFWVDKLKSGAVRSFFAQLHKQDITHAIFFNDEVVPVTPNFDYKKRPKDPFHQRMHFKRNFMTLNNVQSPLVQQWERERGVKFFLGYMCGKGGINVKLWREKMGEDAPIFPQDVVGFAFNSWHPGNITLINQNTNKPQPYVSPNKVKVAVMTTVARILHYVNPDFDALKKKFMARKQFRNKNYDDSLVTAKRKKMFEGTKKYWAVAEDMPNWEFYNEMWSRVQKIAKSNNDKLAYDYYLKAAVAPKGKGLDNLIAKGVIYKIKDIFQMLTQIEKLLDKTKKKKDELFLDLSTGLKFINGGNGVKGQDKIFSFHSCKNKAPHFICDIENCCGFLAIPQLTFTKRLLGYIRYDRMQWWKPGIRWPS